MLPTVHHLGEPWPNKADQLYLHMRLIIHMLDREGKVDQGQTWVEKGKAWQEREPSNVMIRVIVNYTEWHSRPSTVHHFLCELVFVGIEHLTMSIPCVTNRPISLKMISILISSYPNLDTLNLLSRLYKTDSRSPSLLIASYVRTVRSRPFSTRWLLSGSRSL